MYGDSCRWTEVNHCCLLSYSSLKSSMYHQLVKELHVILFTLEYVGIAKVNCFFQDVMVSRFEGPGSQLNASNTPRSGASKRVPWRRRAKRVQISKTPMEKARIAATRKARKAFREGLFCDAHSAVLDQAKILSENLGLKDVDKIYRELMQQSHRASHRRSVSRWNAFLRQEVTRRNNGLSLRVVLCASTDRH